MSLQLGDYPASATIDFKWDSVSLSSGSITRATNGSIRIYKGSSVAQRTSANGITDTEDFDSLTGLHHLTIDTSDNTDAGFYAAGNEYQVVLQGAVIDGLTLNLVLAHFSIERANGILALLKGANGLSAIKTDTAAILVDTGTTLDARIPAALVSGRMDVSVGAMAANVLTATAINADAFTAAKFASDVTTEFQAGLATAANLATVAGYLDTEIAAILADTNELQTDWVNGGRLDLILDAINAKTTNLPSDPADASVIAGRFDTLDTSIADLPTNAELATALGTADDAVLAALSALNLTDVSARVTDIWQIHGLDSGNAMTVTPTSRAAGTIAQTISGDGSTTSTVTRTA